MGAVAELAVEAVGVQQREEDLEVLLLAVVGRGGHQQEVAGDGPQQFPQQEALGLVELGAVVVGGELVGLVHHHQVPARGGQEVAQVLGAGQLVDAGDEVVVLIKGVAATGLLDQLAGEGGEGEAELLAQFVLPLLDQATGGDDEHAAGVGAQVQLADVEAGHDGLAGAGVVRQQVAQGLARQQGCVNGGDLVRQGFDVGGVDRHHGVEEVGEVDAVGLRRQFEGLAGGVEGPGPAGDGQGEVGLVAPEEHALAELAGGGLVIDGDGVGADGLGGDDAHHLARFQAADDGVGPEGFQGGEHGPSVRGGAGLEALPGGTGRRGRGRRAGRHDRTRATPRTKEPGTIIPGGLDRVRPVPTPQVP